MRYLLSVILFASAAFAQTSNYPGSLDTPGSLFVTADNVQSALSSAMLAGDTAVVVTSGTGFAANQIATICDAQTSAGKCTSFEHMKITAVSGNILTVTRAFGGTVAAAHAKGKNVSILIDSAHQAVLADAIAKIEAALGANLANVLAAGNLPIGFGSSTGNGIPGSDNPYTAPNTLAVRDGTVASPQASSASPSGVFQRANALPTNNANAWIYDCYSLSGAGADLGCITLTGVVHDATIAKGGTAIRATAYADVPPAVSALSSATLSGGTVTVTTGSAHYARAGAGVIIAGSSGMSGLNATFLVATVTDSTHFTVACGGCSGSPATGGTVTIPVAYYASWDSTWKVTGPNLRVVGHESDMNNQYADSGNDVNTQDATLNYAMYCISHHCTTGLYIDSGDGGTAKYYFPLKFGPNAALNNYPHIDTSHGNGSADFAWIGNGQYLRWADTTAQGNTQAGKWPILGVDTAGGGNTHLSTPTGGTIGIGPNLAANFVVAASKISHRQVMTEVSEANYVGAETGANNAIAGALVDALAVNVPLATGLVVTVRLNHTLQAGANTFNLNAGGAVNIKSSKNAANNIATAYAATGVIRLLYDGTEWLDLSQ